MYSVKFYSYFEDGSHVCKAINCPHYEVYKRKNFASIITYQDFTDTKGVERHVGNVQDDSDRTYYQYCYIENEKGKTVEKISFMDKPR